MFINIVFWLGSDRSSGLFFVPGLLLNKLTFLLPSISLSYFILAVPLCGCLGKHSCTSSSFPIAVLIDICFFREAKWYFFWRSFDCQNLIKLLTVPCHSFQYIYDLISFVNDLISVASVCNIALPISFSQLLQGFLLRLSANEDS